MRRADRSGRRHCRDMGCQRNETACAGRGRAGGRDVNDYDNGRSEKALYNFLSRIEQTAWRVELNHQALHILRLCLFDAPGNVTRRRGPDRAVDVDKTNFLRGKSFRRRCAGEPKEQRNNVNGGASSAMPRVALAIFRSASQGSALHRNLKLLSWGEA